MLPGDSSDQPSWEARGSLEGGREGQWCPWGQEEPQASGQGKKEKSTQSQANEGQVWGKPFYFPEPQHPSLGNGTAYQYCYTAILEGGINKHLAQPGGHRCIYSQVFIKQPPMCHKT